MAVRTVLVAGGAGFTDSAMAREIIQHTVNRVVVVDKLTCAGNLVSLAPVAQDACFAFEQMDICDRGKLDHIFRQHQPDMVTHLVAESHVSRSIDSPAAFIETNILGAYMLLEATRSWWNTLVVEKKSAFCFHHVSTDGVYDDLHGSEDSSAETTSYVPSSPYSAPKANNDHLVHAWLQTYGLSTLIADCSNNYDPCHFPEKLTPLTIFNALAGKPLPVYGSGQQIHDWLYVEDHARALYLVATRGEPGEIYNTGGHNECKNVEMVEAICQLLEKLAPHKPQSVMHYYNLIIFVADRPSRDLHYAIDASKIARELGWAPAETFTSDMCRAVTWYLADESWWRQVQDGSYQGERLGLQG